MNFKLIVATISKELLKNLKYGKILYVMNV